MFLPRCLRTGGPAAAVARPKIKALERIGPNEQIGTESQCKQEETLPIIKSKCIEQRNAQADEPRCAVCGRYGEYICDETEDDVCSLECKAVVLLMKRNKLSGECSSLRTSFLEDWEPDEAVRRLTDEQVLALRNSMGVSVRGESPPPPILDFSSFKLLPKLEQNMEAAGYDSPTSVQMQAIPAALQGRDILVSSHTGSGKTLAFLLPVVFRCCRTRLSRGLEGTSPLALVLAPTRELCEQIEEQAKVLGRGLPFKTALVVGGDAMPQQVYRIRKGVELIVATPGRLLDLLSKHDDINLTHVAILVLDEVDCMLQRGFRDQAMEVLRTLPGPQIMLFSATIPPAIHNFSSSITKKLLVISAGQPSIPDKAIKQNILWVESKSKKKQLFEILRSRVHFHPPVVVFVNSRVGADLLSEAVISVTGLRSASIHGQKSTSERRSILDSFLVGELDVVVATGVLGRGLDLLTVTQVIVFDMPNSLEEYTHQIGRASRMGVPGSAFVFINDESKALFGDLVRLLRGNGVALPQQLLKSPHSRKRKLK